MEPRCLSKSIVVLFANRKSKIDTTSTKLCPSCEQRVNQVSPLPSWSPLEWPWGVVPWGATGWQVPASQDLRLCLSLPPGPPAKQWPIISTVAWSLERVRAVQATNDTEKQDDWKSFVYYYYSLYARRKRRIRAARMTFLFTENGSTKVQYAW